MSNAANESGNQVVAQYKLLPVPEHPIFPGAHAALVIDEEQYNELKDTEMVFASVIRNLPLV